MKRFLYYPGCSQKATSRAYEESLLAVAPKLGLELVELDDWNCCGTTAVMSVNKVLALSLAARNLVLAQDQGLEVVTPCPSCWLSLKKADSVLAGDDPLAAQVREALAAGGYEYQGGVKVRHLLDVLVSEVGPERIQQQVGQPLSGMKIAPYYGCQVLRPYAQGDDPDNPQNLEKLIQASGATPVGFPLRSACCGGTLVATRPQLGERMAADVLDAIRDAGADAVVTPCNLCQVTVEMVQRHTRKLLGEKLRLPILTVTQLIGLALGVPMKQLGLGRSLNSARCMRTIRERVSAA